MLYVRLFRLQRENWEGKLVSVHFSSRENWCQFIFDEIGEKIGVGRENWCQFIFHRGENWCQWGKLGREIGVSSGGKIGVSSFFLGKIDVRGNWYRLIFL